jgi:hypothetical protein
VHQSQSEPLIGNQEKCDSRLALSMLSQECDFRLARLKQDGDARKSEVIVKKDGRGRWYGSDLFAIILALLVLAGIMKLIDIFPETSGLIMLWVGVLWIICVSLLVIAVFIFMLIKHPPFLVLIGVIILIILGYFFTKVVLGTIFVVIGIMFLLGRPYWVGLVLAVAGAIILFHKSC